MRDRWRLLETGGDQRRPLETVGDWGRPASTVGDCWRLGETSVDRWRLLETGGDQRRPLETVDDCRKVTCTTSYIRYNINWIHCACAISCSNGLPVLCPGGLPSPFSPMATDIHVVSSGHSRRGGVGHMVVSEGGEYGTVCSCM